MYKRLQLLDGKYHKLLGSYKTVEEASQVINFEAGEIKVVCETFVEPLMEESWGSKSLFLQSASEEVPTDANTLAQPITPNQDFNAL